MSPETPVKWHPLQAVREPEPGHWELWDGLGAKYGDVKLVRSQGKLGYRVLVLNPHATAPADLGLAPTLRAAVEAIQKSWVAGHVTERHDPRSRA